MSTQTATLNLPKSVTRHLAAEARDTARILPRDATRRRISAADIELGVRRLLDEPGRFRGLGRLRQTVTLASHPGFESLPLDAFPVGEPTAAHLLAQLGQFGRIVLDEAKIEDCFGITAVEEANQAPTGNVVPLAEFTRAATRRQRNKEVLAKLRGADEE